MVNKKKVNVKCDAGDERKVKLPTQPDRRQLRKHLTYPSDIGFTILNCKISIYKSCFPHSP